MRFERLSRRFLPRSLLGRSMLIVLLPLLVTQGVALALFYGTYLNVASRRLSTGIAGQIAVTATMLERSPNDVASVLSDASRETELQLRYRPGARIGHGGNASIPGPIDEDFETALHQALPWPYSVEWQGGGDMVRTDVQLPRGVLEVLTPGKRLSIEPLWFFVAWAVGSAVLLFLVAGLFMRNQVRAIRRLAEAAEMFGLGRDRGAIKPQGAREVRQAALAFNRMQERVNRFVTQRTAVLAGVSHDLRTPLTRLRLTIAMLPTKGLVDSSTFAPDISDMITDIADMERLIGSYLSFARGEGAESPVVTDLIALLDEVITATRRAGGRVIGLNAPERVDIVVRPDAIRRVLTNLADNARRHGGGVRFSVQEMDQRIDITVEDDGPGMSEAGCSAITDALRLGRPRTGSGLGLMIVRDIVRLHGGSLKFTVSPLGGLRILISLPR